MAKFSVFRETALPSTLQSYSLYFIAPPSHPEYMELYGVSSDGSAIKRLMNLDDVQSLIDSALSGISAFEVVDTIAQRDALALTVNTPIFVADASGDPTVSSGSATYIYRMSTNEWIKIGESESYDIISQWDNIVGRPSSTPAQIDTAVANSHSHPNKTQLDLIGENANQELTYRGELPVIAWTSVGW